jgi:hypothetical protein
MLSRAQKPYEFPERQPRQIWEQISVLTQHGSVVACVGHQQDERFNRIVSSLEVQTTLESLRVTKSHFQLDAGSATAPKQHGIPGALLTSTLWQLR